MTFPTWYTDGVTAVAIKQLQQQAASAAKTPDPKCFKMGGEACFDCGACVDKQVAQAATVHQRDEEYKNWRHEPVLAQLEDDVICVPPSCACNTCRDRELCAL